MVQPGKKYRHFKGHEYEVICLAKDSETQEDVVVYQNINDKNSIWIRPLSMFTSKVDKEKYPDINQEYRFEEIK